jgi:hypothetical protein
LALKGTESVTQSVLEKKQISALSHFFLRKLPGFHREQRTSLAHRGDVVSGSFFLLSVFKEESFDD